MMAFHEIVLLNLSNISKAYAKKKKNDAIVNL